MTHPFLNHQFHSSIATKYGVDEAILIHHILFWIDYNKKTGRNFHEGRYWMYQTLDELAIHFPFWTKSQIQDTLSKLCSGKNRKSKSTELDFEPVLIKGNFNKTAYDRTTWYAFIDTSIGILGNPNQGDGKSQSSEREIPPPIPDNKTDNKTNKINKQAPPAPLLLSFGEKVKLTQKHYDELCKDFGKEPVDFKIATMNEFLVRKNKTYKNYYLELKHWFKNDKNSGKSPISQIESNKEYAKKIKTLFPQSFITQKGQFGPQIEITTTGIAFHSGGHGKSLSLPYETFGFKDQAKSNCYKKNLRHKDL